MYYIDFMKVFDDIITSIAAQRGMEAQPKPTPVHQKPVAAASRNFIPTFNEIPIARVIYSGNTTIVYFTDNTYAIVNCSAHDNYDRQTAIAYALLKRMFGKIGKLDKKTKKFNAMEVDGSGLGIKLQKIADNGYDQDYERQTLASKKASAKEAHAARQKAEHEAAWKKRVKKRAESILLDREANEMLDSLRKTDNSKKQLIVEDVQSPVVEDSWKTYRRPDKPFSKFTDEEKRAYWRYHNAKRKASK